MHNKTFTLDHLPLRIQSLTDTYKVTDLVVQDCKFRFSAIGRNFYIRRSDSSAVFNFNFKEVEDFDPSISIVNYAGKISYPFARELMDYYSLYKLAIEKFKKLSFFI